MQLHLFEKNDETKLLAQELALLRQLVKKMKKELAQRHHELAKWCVLLEEENSLLKKRLLSLEKNIYPDRAQEAESERLLEKLFSEAYLSEAILAER